jgi:hypothetical protein
MGDPSLILKIIFEIACQPRAMIRVGIKKGESKGHQSIGNLLTLLHPAAPREKLLCPHHEGAIHGRGDPTSL